MTETEFLDRKLGEIADNSVKENSIHIQEINSQASLAGQMGGSRQRIQIEESFKSHFHQGVIGMAEFALQHCADNGHPKEFAMDAFKRVANTLLNSMLADFEARLIATAARSGGHGPTAQQEIASGLKSELESVLKGALLDMERGYAGTKQISTSGPIAATKELEQKFGILFSLPQASSDFDEWVADSEDQGFSIGVLFIDIDHFKNLNERYTETEVDKTILPEFQNLLKQLAANRGAAYRHGGEEFVVLLPNHDSTEVMAFAEKVREVIESHRFQAAGKDEKLTVSIGVAIWPAHGDSLAELMSAANNAENEAKKEGRNIVKIASAQV